MAIKKRNLSKERILRAIKAPHVTEKTNRGHQEANSLCFKVNTTATKAEIAAAVVELFGDVSVKKVNTLVIKGKTKRTRNGIGRRSDVKKAYVTLAEGSTISFENAEQ